MPRQSQTTTITNNKQNKNINHRNSQHGDKSSSEFKCNGHNSVFE